MTNAICSMYFHKRKKNSSKGWADDTRNIGLIYPCVHFLHESFNLVMRQQEANRIFRISKLDIYEYLGYNNGLIVRHLADGKVFQGNGNVSWMKDHSAPVQIFI